ncbi:26S proteasome non-ATPase regulatory subunit 1 homolog A [Tanacetum coccineum]
MAHSGIHLIVVVAAANDLNWLHSSKHVVAGEASGISMGLLMVGTACEKASEMLVYAHETQHEKIIRVGAKNFKGFKLSLVWWAYSVPKTGAAITIRYKSEVSNVFSKW